MLRIITVCLLLIGSLSLQLLLTEPVLAQGLVPACPAGEANCENEYSPDNYGFCEVVSVVDNVLRLLLILIAIAAVIIVVYIGIIFVTSQGDSGKITRGKEMFVNVVVGFVITLTAYLIVSTILSVLVGSDNTYLSFEGIECSYANRSGEVNTRITLNNTGVDEIVGTDGDVALQGSAGGDMLGLGGFGGTQGGKLFEYSNAGVCEQSFLQRYFPGETGVAACVAQGETTCGALFYSTTDKDANGEPFSVSAWQINLTVHEVQGCAQFGAPSNYIDCKQAYSGKNYSARIVNRDMYNTCVRALGNLECATLNAQRIRNTSRGWLHWSAYNKGNCGRYR